jgi:hypothetical protein
MSSGEQFRDEPANPPEGVPPPVAPKPNGADRQDEPPPDNVTSLAKGKAAGAKADPRRTKQRQNPFLTISSLCAAPRRSKSLGG